MKGISRHSNVIPDPMDSIFISVSFLISPYLEFDDYRNVPVLSLFDLRSHQIVPDIILSFILV